MFREIIISTLMKIPLIIRLFLIAILLNVFVGIMIVLAEPKTFPNFFEGIWYSIITSATVGYGDYVPKSVLGKVLTIILIFTGAGFMTYYLTYMAQMMMQKQQDRFGGQAAFKGAMHVIIIGWNERTKDIIETIQSSHNNDIHPIVLIDETLVTAPIKTIHFIKGIPYNDQVLMQANILAATTLIITSDHNVSENIADMKTITTIIAAKGLKPDIKIIAEMLSSSQVENAKRSGADQIIQTTKLTSQAFTTFL